MLIGTEHVDVSVSETYELINNESNTEIKDNDPVLNENITLNDESNIDVTLTNSNVCTKHIILIEI